MMKVEIFLDKIQELVSLGYGDTEIVMWDYECNDIWPIHIVQKSKNNKDEPIIIIK